jgi:multiple antibiotic resistance protein
VDIQELLDSRLGHIIQNLFAIYIVVNPRVVSSIFLGLTKKYTPVQRFRIALRAVLAGGVTLAAFALAGTYLFQFFRIGAASLQIAGGIIVFGLAFALARGKEHQFFGDLNEQEAESAPGAIAYTPLAVPLIAGPSSITVVMTLSAKSTDPVSRGVLIASIGVVAFLCFLSMLKVIKLQERMGHGLTLIMPRIMGLILAVIAVQFIVEGIEHLLPRFAAAWSTGLPG